MHITTVRSDRDLKRFIKLPWSIYRDDPHWVPPLLSEEKKLLDRRVYPFHKHAEVEYFLAEEDGRPVGRIAAIVNRLHNEFHQEKTGFFGFFECVNDAATAQGLLRAAESWLKERGMDRARGPCNFSTNETCGLLVDGFESPPVMMMTYNPRYYIDLLERGGYAKAMDLLAYFILTGNFARDKFDRVASIAAQRAEIQIRPIAMKRFAEELNIIQDIYNQAWEKNWGFIPMTREEIDFTAAGLKSIIDPELVLIAELHGKPVGFALALPDINIILKRLNGRLFPFGWLKIMMGRKKLSRIRIIALGVLRTHQHLGIGTLFYLDYLKRAIRMGIKETEMSWILESNDLMNKPLVQMGAKPYKRYRLYDKTLG